MESSHVDEETATRRISVRISRNEGKEKTGPILLDSEARPGSVQEIVIG